LAVQTILVLPCKNKGLTSAHPAFYFRTMSTRTARTAHVHSAPALSVCVPRASRIGSADFTLAARLLAAALYLLAILLISHGAAG